MYVWKFDAAEAWNFNHRSLRCLPITATEYLQVRQIMMYVKLYSVVLLFWKV